jgi:uncharacterized protein YjbJ (UPF0337 family)
VNASSLDVDPPVLNAAEIEGTQIDAQCLKTQTVARNACDYAASAETWLFPRHCRKQGNSRVFAAAMKLRKVPTPHAEKNSDFSWNRCNACTLLLLSFIWNNCSVCPVSLSLKLMEARAMVDRDRVEGSAKNLGGKVKEAAGKLTGDEKLKNEGRADQVAGKVQNVVGGLKDKLRENLDKKDDDQRH